MLRAIREEVVNQHAHNREEEDEQAPKDFVGHRTVGLEDLD